MHFLGYNFSTDALSSANVVKTWHRILEAFKFGFAYRPYLGDPDFDSNVEKVSFHQHQHQHHHHHHHHYHYHYHHHHHHHHQSVHAGRKYTIVVPGIYVRTTTEEL